MAILTLNFDLTSDSSFCGLLDRTSVGIYMFDKAQDAAVPDFITSVGISNSLADFVRWDDVTTIPALQEITSQAPVKGLVPFFGRLMMIMVQHIELKHFYTMYLTQRFACSALSA